MPVERGLLVLVDFILYDNAVQEPMFCGQKGPILVVMKRLNNMLRYMGLAAII